MEPSQEMKKVIYVAGPISGLPEDNAPAFYEAEKYLKEHGFEVINVFEIQKGQDMSKWTWIDYIMYDLPYLVCCDVIYMLKGWEASYGAIIELMVAFKLGIPIAFEEPPKTPRIDLSFLFEDGDSEDDFNMGEWFDKNMKGEP